MWPELTTVQFLLHLGADGAALLTLYVFLDRRLTRLEVIVENKVHCLGCRRKECGKPRRPRPTDHEGE